MSEHAISFIKFNHVCTAIPSALNYIRKYENAENVSLKKPNENS